MLYTAVCFVWVCEENFACRAQKILANCLIYLILRAYEENFVCQAQEELIVTGLYQLLWAYEENFACQA